MPEKKRLTLLVNKQKVGSLRVLGEEEKVGPEAGGQGEVSSHPSCSCAVVTSLPGNFCTVHQVLESVVVF